MLDWSATYLIVKKKKPYRELADGMAEARRAFERAASGDTRAMP